MAHYGQLANTHDTHDTQASSMKVKTIELKVSGLTF